MIPTPTAYGYENSVQAMDSPASARGGVFVAKRYAHADGTFWGSPETTDALPSGFYEPGIAPGIGAYLRRLKTTTDNLLRLPDPVCDMLLKEFVDFWGAAPEMAKRGLSCKRGLLLYGPPGSGKTSAVQLMAQHMIQEMKGIVVLVGDPQVTAMALALFRKLEPDRPVILIYEDIDAMVQRYMEASLLALLDGELQISGVVNVATTNYPELLDPRFTDRPGRFDRIALVGMPEAPARAAYFEAKAPDVPEPRRAQWVLASDGWSIAHMRELIVSHLVLGEDDADVIKRLNDMRENLPKSGDAAAGAFGFSRGLSKRDVLMEQARRRSGR